MARVCRGLAALCIVALFAAVAPAGERTGLVVVAGGVGGLDPLGMWAKLAWPLTGVSHEVRDFVWTTGFGNLVRDIQDTPNVMAHADRLARQVVRYKADYPDRPVYLVGHSGGTG